MTMMNSMALRLARSSFRSSWCRCLSTTAKGIPYSDLVVGIPKERFPLEKRVAASPESVQRLVQHEFKVVIEEGAGALSYFSNADYEAAGATIVDNVWNQSDIVLKVSFVSCL
jgi:NAD(P) transhydrogenase